MSQVPNQLSAIPGKIAERGEQAETSQHLVSHLQYNDQRKKGCCHVDVYLPMGRTKNHAIVMRTMCPHIRRATAG